MTRLHGIGTWAAGGVLAALLALSCGAAEDVTPLFADDAPLSIVIEAPFTSLVRTAERSMEVYPGTLTLVSAGGGSQAFAIGVNARGLTRRTGDFCRFPPLRVDFDKSALDGTLFDGQNRLKLVTYCRNNTSYEQLYVLEHLAYRFYNEITPESFRVRTAQVTYRDSEGRRRDVTRFGFFIEDVDDLAERDGREELEVGGIEPGQLEPAAAARYALFQLMIGNLDWSFLDGPAGEDCCHNTKLLARPDSPAADIVPAPYDFDFSGLVDAPYASTPEGLDVTSVRQRLYRGLCRHEAQLPEAVATFQARRAAIFALVANETRLSEGNRRKATRYLENFYEILDDPRAYERMITRRCRNE